MSKHAFSAYARTLWPRGDAKIPVIDAAGVYDPVSLGHWRKVHWSREAKPVRFRAWRDYRAAGAVRAWTRLVTSYAEGRDRDIEVDAEKMGAPR